MPGSRMPTVIVRGSGRGCCRVDEARNPVRVGGLKRIVRVACHCGNPTSMTVPRIQTASSRMPLIILSFMSSSFIRYQQYVGLLCVRKR